VTQQCTTRAAAREVLVYARIAHVEVANEAIYDICRCALD
jgi:hypothetical protein